MKITVACIAFGIGVCFRCVHVPSVAHAMFAAVLVIAMTPSVGLKRGLLIYEGPSLTQVQNDHSFERNLSPKPRRSAQAPSN